MQTLAILKPHVVKNPVALNHIFRLIEENKFKILKKSRVKLNKAAAETFYQEHLGKFYYNRLASFMTR